MTSIKRVLALTAASVCLTAMPVDAAVMGFVLGDLNWTIDTGQAPFSADVDGIVYAGVDTGTATGPTSADIDFFAASNGGGVRVTDFGTGDILGWFSGPALYSSTGGMIAFTAGTFTLNPVSSSGGPVSITVSAVPEPASWMLMIAGFGMVGQAMRGYRRRRTDTAIAV